MSAHLSSPSTERLAGLLDRLEGAQDQVKAAFAQKREVENEIRDALGIEQRFMSDDKLTATLLRELVKARQSEKEASPHGT